MEAYATIGTFDPDFADHDWCVENVKNKAKKASDFSTVWRTSSSDIDLQNYDDALYLYGGRSAIYAALEPFESARLRNFVGGRRTQPIHVFRAVVKVGGGKTKQIIMLAVADAQRDSDLADFRDTDLEYRDPVSYRMREFRDAMAKKWPAMADD